MNSGAAKLPREARPPIKTVNARRPQGVADQPPNPPSVRDELIFALEHHSGRPAKTAGPTPPEAVRLGETPNALNYECAVPSRGGQLERQIWDEFTADEQALQHLAEAIAHGAAAAGAELEPADEDEIDFPEGKTLYRLHRRHERDPSAVQEVKRRAMETNSLHCAVCKFNFLKAYGENYIECHYTVPVSEYRPGQKIRPTDLALVCANCHRMLHRRRPWRTIDQLATLRIG